MKYLLPFAATILMSLTSIISSPAQASETGSERSPEDNVKITLTIGETVVPAILYNTPPARDLMAKLPVTVSLNRGPVDYCGGIEPINYGEDDGQAGYRSGDLAYWIPGQDFVIFTETEETSSGAPDLVILGQISADIQEVLDLGSTIKVTIALDRENGLTLSDMQVKITAKGHTATFQLYDTVAAKEFYDQLPLELDLSNFRDAQRMFYPPEKLSVTAREAYHDGKKGELSYYEPWGDVFMLYEDFYAGDEMHRLGINVTGLEEIAGMSGKARIEKNESNTLEDQTAMQIHVKTNGNTVVFELNDSTAAKALYAQLPLSITVENFSNNEKIFYPPEKLNTTDTPLAKNLQAGTLAYYAPWGDVVMFYGGFSPAAGLYELGYAISGSEYIQGMSGTIEIEKGSAAP